MGKLCTTGKARQALYDAIKKAREGQEAWVTFEGTRIQLSSSEGVWEGYGSLGKGLVKFNGKIRIADIFTRDSYLSASYEDGLTRRIQEKEILAKVIEEHDRKLK